MDQFSPGALIHPAALVSENARVESGCRIGAYSIVHSGVEIGAGSTIGEYCVLGGGPLDGKERLVIGRNTTIRSHSVIYAGSKFGERLETGHHVVIRERTIAGNNLRAGNFNDIEGHCEIGDYCRFHGFTHVGKGSQIGNFVWLFSLTTATNDPLPPSHHADPVLIGDGVVVCVGAILMPGTSLGDGAFVTAGTHAGGMVPPGAVVSGADGRIVNHVANLIHMPSGTRHPWMKHFTDAYPEECHARLAELQKKILENRFTLNIAQ